MRKYIPNDQADKYMRRRVDALVRLHLQGNITQRDTDAFRGTVDALWHTNAITWKGYLFLCHFAAWLDGDRIYGTQEDRWHQEFVNITEEELRERGLLDEEE